MDMRSILPLAALLAALSPAAGDPAPPDRLDAGVLTVRSVEPLTNGQARIDVSASAGIAGGLSVTGAAEFPQGIAHLAPAPDLPMGPFTNVGWTAAGTPRPEWWAAHGVVDAEAAPNDFAAVAQGQVKWLAHSAALSFAEAEVPGGSYAADIAALVGSFTPSNNTLPATLGQLKAVAEPFWALLEEVWWWEDLPPGWRPWTGVSPQDFALANVGQAKNAFSFNLPPLYLENTDFDGDGVPDGHERFLYGTDGDFWDTDGDGLSDGEEIARGTNPLARDTDGDGYADGTDPDPLVATSWTDADGDGFPDAWRDFWFGTNAAVSASGDANTNGISNLASLLMGVNPVASPVSGFASECGDASEWFAAWELAPSAFTFVRPADLTTLVTRTFRVDRVSPWQQLFVSARAIGAEGWMASDVSIRYGIDGGPVTNLIPAASADSWRIPLGSGSVTNLTFVIEATGAAPSLSRPLHVIRWSPHVELAEDEAGRFLPMDDGKAPLFLARRRAESGWYVVPFTTSLEWIPHLGEIDAEMAAELALPPVSGLSVTNGSERAFLARDPVWAELPPEGVSPAVRVCCWELEQETPGVIGSGPRASQFDSPYPLSSPALRKAFHRAREISAGPSSPVTVRILPRHPLVGLSVDGSSARFLRSSNSSTNDAPGEVDVCPPDTVTPEFDGVPDPDDAYSVDVANSPDEGVETSPSEDDEGGCGDPDPEKGDCDCAGDEDGTSQCSFRLRISLGSPTPGEVAGFVWTSLDEPTVMTPAVFHVLGTDAVAATTNALGEFTVTCSAPAGRTVQVTNIVHGVALTVWNASGRLENRWEVTNPDGDARYVRCRKLTISGNAVSDETFDLDDDDGMYYLTGGMEGSRVEDVLPSDCFRRMDEIRGVFTGKRKWRTNAEEPDFVTDVQDEMLFDDYTSISSVMSEFEKVGMGSQARRRLARRYGYDEKGSFSETMDYWNDPANPYRHARLKSVRSDRRPWSYHDYDALGRETVRIEQLDGSLFPEGLVEVSHLVELPQSCSAKAVVTSYEPGAGDSRNRNDAFLPRRMDTWVMRAGKPPLLVGTETWRYTRTVDAQGVALRSCVHASGVGETLRTETTVEYPEDDYSVPKCLRGRMVSRTGFDGVTISCQVETGNWNESSHAFSPGPDGAFLRTTTRRVRNGAEAKTFTAEVEDVLRRLAVYTATRHTESGDALDWSASTYDDIDRLRSTMYSDGTSETNAYSCCRLLWRRDRQGRKVLRSAQTGTDDLYYAEEDVWLADVSTNGHFRVTQHFFDALGRETNTVTYAGTTPGEAAVPIGEAAILPLQNAGEAQLVATVTTTYPADAWGGSYWGPYSIRTDERGRETFVWESQEEGYTQTDEKTYTNGVFLSEVITTANRNGTTTAERYWIKSDGSDAWTRVTHSTDWLPDCRRVVIATTTASDRSVPSFGYVVVTNSISTYDLFGRIESTVVPGANGSWLVTSNAYDGTSSRILASTLHVPTLPPRTTTYLYNDLGEQVGTVVADVTNRTDVTYENIGGEWWKVETSAVIGPETNAVSFMRERQTGLSDACRRHVVEIDANGATTETFSATGFFYSLLGTEVETVNSSTGPTVVRYGQHGVIRGIDDEGELKFVFRDAFGREAVKVRVRDDRPLQQFVYNPFGDLIEMLTCTNDWEMISESYAYDMFGNRIATTDALGNTVYKSYDPFGHVVAEWGAAYPVRYDYDSQGRRVSLSTTRDGATWDTTTWTYDFRSGLCTSKTYADGSTVTNIYTPDKLPLRTTYASGKWKENVYDEQRRLCSVVYSSPDMDYELQFDVYGNATNVQDAAGNTWRYEYGSNSSLLGEEFITTGGTQFIASAATNSLIRTLDPFGRPSGYVFSVNGIAKGGMSYAYDGDGLVCGIVATNSSGRTLEVEYGNQNGYNYGHCITIDGDDSLPFDFQVSRDEYRRNLVTSTCACLQSTELDSRSYEYDALGRLAICMDTTSWFTPPSVYATYAYNSRSEVVSSAIGTNLFTHAYDEIGNHLLFGNNAATNTFTHNQVNQMVTCVLPGAPPTTLTYTPDGGLASDGTWVYEYDAEDQLASVTSATLTNGAIRVLNSYDYRHRRIGKTVERYVAGDWQATECRTFVYDDWNLIHETVYTVDSGVTNVTEIQYFWGLDLSGTLQGAGGVGGLLAVSRNGQFYFPAFDNNGNVTKYIDESGNVVAAYEYDDFGRTISQSGPLADFFRHRFSTKYYDPETGLYYYGYRYYYPILMRWFNRDPLEEDGGGNLYSFVLNRVPYCLDKLGLYRWVAIYYSRFDQPEFRRAAETYKNEIERSSTFNSKCDSVIIKGAFTADEFRKVWGEVNNETRKEGNQYKIKSLHIFTHSGPGRLFLHGTSLKASSIEALTRLNWATGGHVVCHGCNTGIHDEDGNSVAKSLAVGQGVRSLGQTGFAQFSENLNRRTWFTRVDSDSQNVYLWSYGDGGPTWTFGKARTPKIEYPPKEGKK